MTIIFRRDPLATDTTYRLEGTSDLVNWAPLAVSVAGATPTGRWGSSASPTCRGNRRSRTWS
jgi:hypothetical protein